MERSAGALMCKVMDESDEDDDDDDVDDDDDDYHAGC